MTFSAPLWLASLALIPLAIAASLTARRRARRYAVRFPAASTLALAAGDGSSWRRRVPALLALAALAALGFALARPHVSYSAPVDQAGAIRNEYSDSNECGWPRRAAWPVLAIARESWLHSSSSVNSHGVFRNHASIQ